MRRCTRGMVSLCAAAALMAVLVSAGAAWAGTARPPATVSVSDASRVVFRVKIDDWKLSTAPAPEGTVRLEIPGFVDDGDPGEPATPARQFLVALPPSGAWGMSFRVLSSTPLGVQRLQPVPFQRVIQDDLLGPLPEPDYRFDAETYGAWSPSPMVEARPVAWVRRNRVLPVQVHPLSYDPSSGEAALATEIEITVSFSPDRGEPGRPVRESDMWRGIYARMFVNPSQAQQWRAQQRFDRYAAQPSAGAVAQGGTLMRVKVRKTGMHGVSAAALTGAGFPAGRNIDDLSVFQRTYDDATMTPGVDAVAFYVDEDPAGVAGVFDAGDLLVFYGRRLHDDPDQLDPIEKFADHNVYWVGTGGGPQMVERTLAPGFVTADTASASFAVSDHFEVDTFFREDTRPDGGPDFYMFNTSTEHTLLPTDAGGPDGVDLPLELWTVRPGTNVRVQARLFGATYRTGPRLVWTGINNGRGEHPIDAAYSIPSKTRATLDVNVPGADFDVGYNEFRIRRPDGSRPAVEVYTNWVNLEYEALYRARGNRLDFNTATLSGDTSVTVTGLSDQSLWLFDITDPDHPVRCRVEPSLFTDVGGSYAMSFRDNVGSQKSYTLLPPAAVTRVDAADVSMDTPSSIIGDPAEGGVDVLVVAYRSFVGQMQQWAAYRRAQGYRVLVTDVRDLYDEFNNGVPNALAVDRFVRRFFELGGASVLVLVGDSSEDNKIIHDTSGPNFVPTHSWADNVPSLRLDEVVTTDKRYVKLPGPGGVVDDFPDMVVGRLPVGSANELTIVLNKIQTYERAQAGELWRRRIIAFADDRYSVGASDFGGFYLCTQQSERAFENGQETASGLMEAGIGGYEVLRFYLGDYTEGFYNGECKTVIQAIDFARANVTPLWLAQLSQGASIVTLQAHMNRSLVTHESVFSTLSPNLLGSVGTGRDHQNIDNRGRPFVMFAMGCHFSDYALHKEQSQQRINENRPNGDSFAEQLVLANNKGAAAVFGSSGFEYLNQTNAFMNTVAGVWFYQAPYEDLINETQAQWVLGQLMLLVETQLATSQSRPIERYHILGDPLLRIDAGPPAFEVTVNGSPFEDGGLVASGGASDTLQVEAVVSDENAILDFGLEVAGADLSNSITVTPLVDQQLPNSRQYRVSFSHVVRPETYDIVLRAYQSPDTAAGQFNMISEFRMRVVTDVSVSVNGRPVQSGDNVPAVGDYRIDMTFPTFVPESQIAVSIDGSDVTAPSFSHPSPQDTTSWIVTFSQELGDGRHTLVVSAAGTDFTFELVVSSEVGLRNVIPYPNPFTDNTYFVFSNDVVISDGYIDVFTSSGKRIRRIDIPPEARQPGQNAVLWDGRDAVGDEIANGTYLFIVRVTQLSHDTTVRGKLSRIK